MEKLKEIKELSKVIVKQAKAIKDVVEADYLVVEKKEEEGDFIMYTITHALLCERLLHLINSITKNDHEKDEFNLD